MTTVLTIADFISLHHASDDRCLLVCLSGLLLSLLVVDGHGNAATIGMMGNDFFG